MNTLRQSWVALRTLLLLTVVLGLVYPLAMTAIAFAFPSQAQGSLITVNGQVVGSALLGQHTDDPSFFLARPSASDQAGSTSGGSNLSPTAPDLATAMAGRRAALLTANPDAVGPVPDEALTASASGLDPDISPAYASWQAPRVAAARNLPLSTVQQLIGSNTHRALLGFIGTDTVNVTELNVALAERKG
jgi:potassium-transporting ATPase KdpC subunit